MCRACNAIRRDGLNAYRLIIISNPTTNSSDLVRLGRCVPQIEDQTSNSAIYLPILRNRGKIKNIFDYRGHYEYPLQLYNTEILKILMGAFNYIPLIIIQYRRYLESWENDYLSSIGKSVAYRKNAEKRIKIYVETWTLRCGFG